MKEPASAQPRLARAWPGLLAAGLALAACGRPVSPAAPAPAQPAPPAAPPAVLVYGPVASPIADELGKRSRMVRFDGTQAAKDYSLLVFDGDAQAPQALAREAYLKNALRTGVGVLALDVSEAHKRELGQVLDFASKGGSPAYFAQLEGRSVRVVEYPSGAVPGASHTAPLALAPLLPASAREAASFLDKVTAGLGPGGLRPQDSSSLIPTNIPYKRFVYTQGKDWNPGQTLGNQGAGQVAHYEVTYTFHVFLNNDATNAGQPFQFVVAEVDATANPTSGTRNFTVMNYAGNGRDANNLGNQEVAWIQSYLRLTLTPSLQGVGLQRFGDTTPVTANNVTSVTSGSSFTIGFTASKDPNVNGSYTYSNSVSRDIPNWKVRNNGSGLVADWEFVSVDPLDDDAAAGGTFPQGAFGGDSTGPFPLRPNDLAMSTLSFHGQAIYRTDVQSQGVISFATNTVYALTDLYCPALAQRDGPLYCSYDNLPIPAPAYKRITDSLTPTLFLNLASVVPVDVTGVTFGPYTQANPVPAGRSVTGTVTLAGPANADTNVNLSSSSQFATVLPYVTVPKGQTSATFEIKTSADPLRPNLPSEAVITTSAPSVVDTLSTLYIQNSTDPASYAVTITGISGGPDWQNVILAQNANRTVTLGLDRPAPAGGLTLNVVWSLNSVNPTPLPYGTVGTYPATVTFPAGQTTATFPVTFQTSAAGKFYYFSFLSGGTVKAQNGFSVSRGDEGYTVSITDLGGPQKVSITQDPDRTVTLALDKPAPAGGLTLKVVWSLTPGYPTNPLPDGYVGTYDATVTFPAGQTSAQFGVDFSVGGDQTFYFSLMNGTLLEAQGSYTVGI